MKKTSEGNSKGERAREGRESKNEYVVVTITYTQTIVHYTPKPHYGRYLLVYK